MILAISGSLRRSSTGRSAAAPCTASRSRRLTWRRPAEARRAREALERVLTALDADVTLHSVPVTQRDLGPDGEIGDPRILDQLQGVVAELASRAR